MEDSKEIGAMLFFGRVTEVARLRDRNAQLLMELVNQVYGSGNGRTGSVVELVVV